MNPAHSAAAKSAADQGSKAAPPPLIPFTHASHQHVEAIADTSDLITANTNQKGPFDIPAYGYVRNVFLLVTTSGGVDGTATAHEDAPFNVLQNVSVEDVNGTPIVGPLNGEELLYINKYGGYEFYADPEQLPDYTAGPCTFNFSVRVPVEINQRTGLGCLSNMNSSANYKLRYTLNLGTGATGIVTAIGTGTLPTVRVRSYLEAWSLPPDVSRDGFPIMTEPPLLGTTQYWTKRTFNAAAGQQVIPLTRVGNQIRTLIVVARSTAPARSDALWPDPLTFAWDARTVFVEPASYRKKRMGELWRYTRAAHDTGVYAFPFSFDSSAHPGGEDDGHLWLRTVQASRLELQGVFTGAPGVITILTNDVAPVATSGRYTEVNRSGGIPGAGSRVDG
jgi:hypothetical protein